MDTIPTVLEVDLPVGPPYNIHMPSDLEVMLSSQSGAPQPALLGAILLIVVVVLGGLVAVARWLRGRLTKDLQRDPVFPMDDLEAMRDSGLITGHEFERLKLAALKLDGPAGEKAKRQLRATAALDDEEKDAKE